MAGGRAGTHHLCYLWTAEAQPERPPLPSSHYSWQGGAKIPLFLSLPPLAEIKLPHFCRYINHSLPVFRKPTKAKSIATRDFSLLAETSDDRDARLYNICTVCPLSLYSTIYSMKHFLFWPGQTVF